MEPAGTGGIGGVEGLLAAGLDSGSGFMHDLMTAVGPAADGMIASSRRRLLAHLRAGDAEEAALETQTNRREASPTVA